ncbi:KGK domain-containing protein [Calothrix rhizosoleniae]|uniref:KGK domain-containing protein n=1 Tax=Calothrix rhizosoleniae TaxID=888997 RepID=UPI000B49A64D|nr:KGK domain-containing protein [Calothrix rhizosoleniae]
MGNNFKPLDDDSVVSWGCCTLKVNQFLSHIYGFLRDKGWENIRNNLYSAGSGRIPKQSEDLFFIEGIDCEILKPGKSWEKGKLKITISVEFQPDEPEVETTTENTNSESSLDDIRRKLNQVN